MRMKPSRIKRKIPELAAEVGDFVLKAAIEMAPVGRPQPLSGTATALEKGSSDHLFTRDQDGK